jgi:hypothetical protein
MSTRAIGILLILIGLAVWLVPTLTFTTRETVLDAGPLEVTTERERSVPLWPVLGGVAAVAGLVLVLKPGPRH